MPGGGKWLLSLNGWRQTSSGNNSVYVAHMPNNTQIHILLSTGDFYQEIHQRPHASPAARSHVCRLIEGRRKRGTKEVRKHVTVALRVHRPGLTLGKSPSGFLMTPEGRLSSFRVLGWRCSEEAGEKKWECWKWASATLSTVFIRLKEKLACCHTLALKSDSSTSRRLQATRLHSCFSSATFPHFVSCQD